MVVTEIDEMVRLGHMHVPLKEFADEAGVLNGREAGANARHTVERALATGGLTPGDVIALDFKDIRAVSAPFADECLGQLLSGRLAGYYEDHPILAVNASEDVAETLTVILRQRHLVLLGVGGSGVQLLGGDQLLTATLRAASQVGGAFSATDLARKLGVSPQAMNNRLKALLRSGALSRTRVMPSRGGREFEYELPTVPSRKSAASTKRGGASPTRGGRSARSKRRPRQPA